MSSTTTNSTEVLTAIFALVFYLPVVIAMWKIFAKAGEASWRALVPILNEYTLFKISRISALFWLNLIAQFALGIVAVLATDASGATSYSQWQIIVSCGALLMILICSLAYSFKLVKAFGYGIGLGVLNAIFPNIVLLVLGFGKSQYRYYNW